MLIKKDNIDWKLYKQVIEEERKSCKNCCFQTKVQGFRDHKCSIIGHMDCTHMIYRRRNRAKF